jgi:thiamine biosynthesis lipoprotein
VGPDADAAGADAGRDGVRGRIAAIAALAPVLTWGAASVLATGLAAPLRIETSAPHMGTLVRIVLYADTAAAGEAATQAAFARIAAIDARLSDYRDDSEVAALSHVAAGVPVPVSEDLFAVLAASDALARRTGGAFDITAGRLTHLWRRARRLNAWPEADRVGTSRCRFRSTRS